MVRDHQLSTVDKLHVGTSLEVEVSGDSEGSSVDSQRAVGVDVTTHVEIGIHNQIVSEDEVFLNVSSGPESLRTAPEGVAQSLVSGAQRLVATVSRPNAVTKPSGFNSARVAASIARFCVVIIAHLVGVNDTITTQVGFVARLARLIADPSLSSLPGTVGSTSIATLRVSIIALFQPDKKAISANGQAGIPGGRASKPGFLAAGPIAAVSAVGVTVLAFFTLVNNQVSTLRRDLNTGFAFKGASPSRSEGALHTSVSVVVVSVVALFGTDLDTISTSKGTRSSRGSTLPASLDFALGTAAIVVKLSTIITVLSGIIHDLVST